MKRTAIAVCLVLSACGSSTPAVVLPDQGTIDVCTSIVGFAQPEGSTLASAIGWLQVARAGVRVSQNQAVIAASRDILRHDTAYMLTHKGFTPKQIKALVKATGDLQKACDESNAYKGKAKQLYGNQ